MPNLIWLLCILFAAITLSPAAEAQAKRAALVIGNAAYKEAPLKNPVNDARAMAAKLKELGFDVLLRENTTKLEMERAIADFGDMLDSETTGLFFYAGHGLQVDGRNFLVPTDARIATQQRVRLETLDVDLLLDQMAAAGARVNLVILDACRNNPFERRFRATGGGLAQINAPQGTLISYATAPGKVAADGNGANGLYTSQLLRALDAPGLPVEEVFKRVRIEVSNASQGAQTPWEASSLTGAFYFRAAAPLAAAPAQAAPPAPALAPPPTVNTDAMFWSAVQGSDDPALLEAYLQQFPTGMFAPIARARIEGLRKPPSSQPVAAPKSMPAPVVAAGSPARQDSAPSPPQQVAALTPAPEKTPSARKDAGPSGLTLLLRQNFKTVVACAESVLQLRGNTLCTTEPYGGNGSPGFFAATAAGSTAGLTYDLFVHVAPTHNYMNVYDYDAAKRGLIAEMRRYAPQAQPVEELNSAGNDSLLEFTGAPPGCLGFDRAGPPQGRGYAYQMTGIVCQTDGTRLPTLAEINALLKDAQIR